MERRGKKTTRRWPDRGAVDVFLLLSCVRGRELRVGRAPRVCAKVSLHTRVVPTKHTSCGRQGPSGTRPMHAHGHSSLYSSEAQRTRLWCAAERERRGHDRAHLEGLVRLRRACTCAQRGARAPADRPGVAGLRRASCAPASPASHPVRPHRTAAATTAHPTGIDGHHAGLRRVA